MLPVSPKIDSPVFRDNQKAIHQDIEHGYMEFARMAAFSLAHK